MSSEIILYRSVNASLDNLWETGNSMLPLTVIGSDCEGKGFPAEFASRYA